MQKKYNSQKQSHLYFPFLFLFIGSIFIENQYSTKTIGYVQIEGKAIDTEVVVKLEEKLKENQTYVLKTEGISDRSENPLDISCNFRAKRSYGLYKETGPHDVYDTVLMGSILYVASGQARDRPIV